MRNNTNTVWIRFKREGQLPIYHVGQIIGLISGEEVEVRFKNPYGDDDHLILSWVEIGSTRDERSLGLKEY